MNSDLTSECVELLGRIYYERVRAGLSRLVGDPERDAWVDVAGSDSMENYLERAPDGRVWYLDADYPLANAVDVSDIPLVYVSIEDTGAS